MSVINFNPSSSPGLAQNIISNIVTVGATESIIVGGLNDNNPSNSINGFITDQLSNLLGLRFDGVPFPAISFKEHGSQDLAIHKYPNLNSGRLENTGRNPSVFSVRAIFTNNIYPSVNESWQAGSLFPLTFNAVLSSLYDTTTPIKTLVHPYIGSINVMVLDWDYEFIGTGPRDGVYMDMVFMETLSAQDLGVTIAKLNPSAVLANVAHHLNTLIGEENFPIQPLNMALDGFFSAISDVVNTIIAIPSNSVNALLQPIFLTNDLINQVSSASQFYQAGTTNYIQIGGASNLIAGVNSATPDINYSYSDLQGVYNAAFSINSAQNNNAYQFIDSALGFLNSLVNYYTSINSNKTASIKLNLYLMIYQLQQIQQTLFANSNKYSIQSYITQAPTTLISLSNILNNSIDQLISLNPTLNQTLYIPSAVQVNYFQG